MAIGGMILRIIQTLFLILVCTVTLAGRPIFDLDEHFILVTGLISFAGLVFCSNTKKHLRIIDILFLIAIAYGLANQRVFNVDLTAKYLSMSGVWVFAKESNSPSFEKGLLLAVVLAAAIHTIVAVLQSFSVLSNFNYFFKTTGAFSNPGQFGCYLSFALASLLPWGAFNYGHNTRTQKVFFILTVILLLYGLALSDSRAAYLATIVTVVICLYLRLRSRIKIKRVHMGALLLLLLGILLALYMHRPSSANARLGIWKITVQAVGRKPVFGYGTDGFQGTYMLKQADYLVDADEEMRRNADEVKTAFNVPLELLYEQGVIGLLLWGTIIFLSIKGKLGAPENKNTLLLFPMLSFLVFSLFSYPHQIWGLTCPFIAVLSLSGNDKTFIKVEGKIGRKILLGLELSLLSVLLLMFVSRALIDRSLIRFSRFDMDYQKVESYHTVNSILYHSPSLLFFWADNQMLLNDYEKAIPTIIQYKKYRIFYTVERNLAYSYEITGDTVRALEHYEVAHAMCPGYMEPLFAQFLIYVAKSDSIAKSMGKEIINFTPKITNSRTDAMKDRTKELINSRFTDCCDN